MAKGHDFSRYSDKRQHDNFSVTLLFSEEVEFDWAEVIEAFEEDFPDLSGWLPLASPGPAKIGDALAGMLLRENAEHKQSIKAVSGPFRAGQPAEAVFDKPLGFKGARAAFDRHTCFLDLTVEVERTGVSGRFEAAKLLTCFSAVFAKLPICLGVWFPSADLIVEPEKWAKAAQTACKGEWPLEEWFGLAVLTYQMENGLRYATISTIGVAAFVGKEVSIVGVAQEDFTYCANSVLGTAWLLCADERVFADGDTLGSETDADGTKVLIRLVPEGARIQNSPPMQTDMVLLYHPNSAFDAVEDLGSTVPGRTTANLVQ